jgi:hypothetical protein
LPVSISAAHGLVCGFIDEKLSGQYLVLICDESLAYQDLNLNLEYFRSFTFYTLVHAENYVCLLRGVQVAGAAWWAATSIVTGVRDLVQRIGDSRTGWILGGQTIERSGDAVCDLHHARGDEEREFLD